MRNELRRGPWKLSDLKDVKSNGLKVFSCFHCGGGSTMGYRLAGFDVLGGVEIDEKMMKLYRANFNPRFSYLMGVQEFKVKKDLPKELLDLDILDGSPPCSSFSMSGKREKDWGKHKKFREGQTDQVLDDLFFHFIDIAKRFRPKVVVAENVKGLVIGNARGYVAEIFDRFEEAGYDTQLFLLNASRMGVPQSRERTFFFARRKDLGIKPITLNFSEEIISVSQAFKGINSLGRSLTPDQIKWWPQVSPGKAVSSIHPKGHWFNAFKLHPDLPAPTLTAATGNAVGFHWSKPVKISDAGLIRIQTFPDDYLFEDLEAKYICGMSVPPFMMQRVALQIAEQWLGAKPTILKKTGPLKHKPLSKLRSKP